MRQEVSWGSGFSSILVNIRTGEVLSYETNREEVHNLMGGRCYYTSRTGLTGAGFVHLTPDWILSDAYRTDVWYEQTKWRHPLCLPNGREWFVFVPLQGHKGIDGGSPAVITDGREELHLVEVDSIATALLGITKGGIETTYHTLRVHEPETLQLVPIKVKVSSEFDRVPLNRYLFRFLELKAFRIYPNSQTLRERYLALFQKDGRQYHVNSFHLIDKVWDSDPTLSMPIDGWYRHGDMYYRRKYNVDMVQAFWEAPRSVFGERYAHPALSERVDYEMDIPILEWVEKPLQEWEASIRRMALQKAIQDLRWVLEGDYNRCVSLLQEADGSILLTREASLEVGNCPTGTDSFIQKYELPIEGITIGELRSHPRLQQMLGVWDFRKVLLRVIDPVNSVPEEVVE